MANTVGSEGAVARLKRLDELLAASKRARLDAQDAFETMLATYESPASDRAAEVAARDAYRAVEGALTAVLAELRAFQDETPTCGCTPLSLCNEGYRLRELAGDAAERAADASHVIDRRGKRPIYVSPLATRKALDRAARKAIASFEAHRARGGVVAADEVAAEGARENEDAERLVAIELEAAS